MIVVNKAALYYFYLYYVLGTGGLAAMICEWFVIISYVTNNYVKLPWIAWAIVIKFSFDLVLLLPYWAVIAIGLEQGAAQLGSLRPSRVSKLILIKCSSQ